MRHYLSISVFLLSVQLVFSQPETEELVIKGTTTIFKVSSGATVMAANSITTLNASNSGALKIEGGGSFTAEGAVNIASGASIQVDGNLAVKGHWSNDATASTALAGATLGTITFNGTANQNIGGSVSTVFENFTIDNTAGVTLTNNETINTALTFANGIITTAANRLDMTGTAADNNSGGGTGKYVLGNFRRYVTTGVEYSLPIGTATNYEMGRLFVNSQAGLTYVDVAFTISNQNPVPGGLTVKTIPVNDFLDYGYWTLTPNGGATANYDFSGQSIGHADQGPDEFYYSLISDLGSGWQDLGEHSIATQSYSASTVLAKRTQLTSFGSYIIGHSLATVYVAPPVTEELLIDGITSIFKVSSGATVIVANSITTLNASNSGILKVEGGGSFTAEGAVNLVTGASIAVDGDLAVKGHWTNDATASIALGGATIGTITFNGIANQNIGGSVSTVFENFTIDNIAGVTLTNDQTISVALTFTDGVITTIASILSMTGTAVDYVSGSGAGKYVLGNFRRHVTTSVEYTLPIGTATNYEMGRLFVNSQAGLTYVDVAFTISNQNPVPGGLTVKTIPVNDFLDYGYWTLTPNGGATANYDFSGQSIGHTDQGPDEFYYSLISDLGSGWQDLGEHSIATQSYSASTVLAKRTQLTSFGSYIIGHSLATIYVAPPVTEELLIDGITSIFKVSSGATVLVANSITTLNASNSGTLKVEGGGSFNADGDMNLASGASIQVDGDLAVKGHWTNDATASTALAGATLGTITFNGTANQNIGGSVSTVFENFTIDNITGVTLANNETINSALTFTNGIITTGANRLDMTGTAADYVSGSGSGKYVLGNFRRHLTISVEYTLPIGTATNYEMGRLFVNNQAGLTYVDASFTISNQNPVPGGLTVRTIPVNDFLNYGYWTLTPNGGATANYDFSGQSFGHTDQGPDEFYYTLISDLGSGWQDLGVHSIATQSYSASAVLAKRTQLTSFGSYIIGHALAPFFVAPPVTEELLINGITSIFKVSSGATVIAANPITTLNASSSGTLKVEGGGSFTADGAVNIASGASIQVDGNLFVRGHWTNNATASTALAGATVGTTTFNGTLNQNIGGSVNTIFENFSINNAAGLTLINNQTISATLTLTSGIITTGAFTLSCTSNSAATLPAGSSLSFVYGTLSKAIVTNTNTYFFSVGSGSTALGYHPMGFINNNLTGVSTLTVSVGTITEIPPNADANLNPTKAIEDGVLITNILESAEWVVNPNAAPTGGDYGINLFVTNISGLSAADDDAFVILQRPLASTTYDDWDTFGSTTTIPAPGGAGRIYNGGNGYAQKSGFTTFSRFAIGATATPLPIELLFFTARFINSGVLLKWVTATEINNDFFVVERSKDAAQWSSIGKVNGAGNSFHLLTYTFVDEKPFFGDSYYRLKQTDFDGNFSYSKVEYINILDGTNRGFDFDVYPNPSKGENIILTVQNDPEDESDVLITISDMHGKFVHPKIFISRLPEGFTIKTLTLGNLAQGMYFITGSSLENTKIKRIIIE